MKLLASDYDGTLRYEPKVVEEDLDALKRWQQAGNLFVVVTGRSMESFMQELKENDFQCDFIVLNNGGVIYDGAGKCLEVRYLDFDKAMELIEYIRTLPCASYVLNDGYHRHRVVIDASQKDLKYGDMPQEKDEKEILEGGKIAQIVISLSDDELAASIVRYINEQFSGFIQAYANRNCVDIVPVGVSKAEGLAYVAYYAGLSEEDVYAIGDSYNDLPMIEEFHGFSVMGAPEKIKESSKQVYLSVADCIDDLLK